MLFLSLIILLTVNVVNSCNPNLPASIGLNGAEVEATQLNSQAILMDVKPADALQFDAARLLPTTIPVLAIPTPAPLSALPTLPALPGILDLLKPKTTSTSTTTTTVQPLIDNDIHEETTTEVVLAETTTTEKMVDPLTSNKIEEEDDHASGNDEDDSNLTSKTEAESTTIAVEENKCRQATVTAITTMSYNDQLVSIDVERIKQQIILLESYTQRRFDSFGSYTQDPININGRFAIEYKLPSVNDCVDLRDYATKAVSYSREIERVLFSCHCEPMWIIAKRRSG